MSFNKTQPYYAYIFCLNVLPSYLLGLIIYLTLPLNCCLHSFLSNIRLDSYRQKVALEQSTWGGLIQKKTQ